MTLYNLNYNVQVEKDAVNPEKVAVEDKNVAIEDEKVASADRLNETRISAPTKEKSADCLKRKVILRYSEEQIFPVSAENH